MHLLLKSIFGIKLYMFRTVPLSIIRSFSLYTQQWYMSYRLQLQLASRIRTERPDPARKLSANLYVLLCVQWKTPDDGQGNCPKHAEFYSKNKFEKLVHLVAFIIRIYHDARSPECQIPVTNVCNNCLYWYKRIHEKLCIFSRFLNFFFCICGKPVRSNL